MSLSADSTRARVRVKLILWFIRQYLQQFPSTYKFCVCSELSDRELGLKHFLSICVISSIVCLLRLTTWGKKIKIKIISSISQCSDSSITMQSASFLSTQWKKYGTPVSAERDLSVTKRDLIVWTWSPRLCTDRRRGAEGSWGGLAYVRAR